MGLRSFRDSNFALDIDDVSRAGVNHGSRLMYFDRTQFTSRNGNDSLNAVLYNIINLEYAKFEHSVLKISLKSVLIYRSQCLFNYQIISVILTQYMPLQLYETKI